MMGAAIQQAEVQVIHRRTMEITKYSSKDDADAFARQIGGIVTKEQGQDIWYVFPFVPSGTVGYATEE